MVYTRLVIRAMKLAYKIHSNQTDRSGAPYIFHPIHLAEQMETEEEIIVALLHDVLEDSSLRFSDLYKYGFNDNIVNAIVFLTRQKYQDYNTYIDNIKHNELARKVKIADLRHNLDISRLKKVTDKDIERCRKYAKALEYLMS